MKFRRLAVLSCFLSLTALGGVAFSFGQAKEIMETEAATYTIYNRNKSTYYTSDYSHKVTSSMYGSTLLSTLHELMFDSHAFYNSYAELYELNGYTDYDIDNTDNIILFYSRQSIDKTAVASNWNREHVWCKSLSGGLYPSVGNTTRDAGTDVHHLRPTNTIINSTRGDTPYGIVSNHSTTRLDITDCYTDGNNFEPADYIKGDIARILMYMYMHYSDEVGGTTTAGGSRMTGALAITNIVNKSTAQAAWDLLMDWNESDPVDYQEMVRNNVACSYTGNYNPFIDHPEYARMIWDDSSSYQAGLSFTTSYKEISVNATFSNPASGIGNNPSVGTIAYTSDNPSVASVSSAGVVTGVSNGVARIKARATVNGISRISYFFVKVGSGYTPKNTLFNSGIVYTPTSATSAKASVTVGSETVSFNNEYTQSKYHTQITSGKKATLTINNFSKTVKSIILSMHSTKDKGSVTITVTIGGKTYKTLSGTFVTLYGQYVQCFVPIDCTNSSATTKTGTIQIVVDNTGTSSVYLEKAIIDYTERSTTKATGITVTPSARTISPGEDLSMLTTFSPSNTTLQTVTWSSSNTSVATVNECGLVRAKSTGSATITATTNDGSSKSSSSTITVSNTVPGDDSGPAVLSSISLNTDNVKKNFVKGDSFTYAGLVVTAHYSDSTSQTVASGYTVSTPNMSTTGNKTVTVTYSGKSAQYSITVSAAPSSISASVSKTYHPGDVIVKSDITVVDDLDNPITDFTFSDNNHRFTYQEAASGGALTNKTFTNSISYNNMTCSLTVQVQRVDYEEAGSVTDEITYDLIGGGGSYADWSNKSDKSPAVYAGNSMKYSSADSIQLRSSNSSGIVSTTSGGTLAKVKVTWNNGTISGRTLNIYGKTSKYNSSADLYSNQTATQGTLLGTIIKGTSTELTITGDYTFVGIRSAGNALYLDKIEITYGAEETAENVANYIMINDTEGQCTGQNGKYNLAIAKLNTMSKDEKDLFWEATENQNYVIFTARTRLEAWARHEHKTLSYNNETFSSSSSSLPLFGDSVVNDPTVFVIIGVSLASVIGLTTFFIYRKKRQD